MSPTSAARQSTAPSLRDRLKDPSLLKRQACYIDGAWVGTAESSPSTIRSTEIELAKVPQLWAPWKRHARRSKPPKSAFPAWAKFTAKQRSNILRKWFELIIANREDLALILTTEQGKPLAVRRWARSISVAPMSSSSPRKPAASMARPFRRSVPDARLLAIKQPIGVCGAITPWNFPNSMITRKVSPALAAGCTVVLKPANETPLSALALAVNSRSVPACPRVCSTSSPAMQRRSARCCASIRRCASSASPAPPMSARFSTRQASVGVKRLGLELGGNAPFVVFDDADIDAAVEGAIVSKYRNMGQTCVCANRLYAQEAIYDRVRRRSYR
jgi:succinate-semialdehyde dehydrogenase/glutarate-semialdehyde dehydrogenase